MPANLKCHCLLCKVEASFTTELASWESHQSYLEFIASRPSLAAFPTALDLIRHLHGAQPSSVLPVADRILGEILKPPQHSPELALVHRLLFLVFVPTMHRTASQLIASFASLAREDIAQNMIASLFECLESREFRLRQSHIAFSLARRIRRSAFRWAIHETKVPTVALLNEEKPNAAETALSLDRSHSAIALNEFLNSCERRGWISSAERHLLTQAKIEGISCQELSRSNGQSAGALQHRIQRALARLRRLTSPPKPAPVQLELFPE
jgi:DNA-directed RNA polymerase specialized sigma24 family protein